MLAHTSVCVCMSNLAAVILGASHACGSGYITQAFLCFSLPFERWGCYYWPTSHKQACCIQIFKALRAVRTSHYQKHWNNWCEDSWFRCPQRTPNKRDRKFPMESFYKSILVLAQHTAQPLSSPEFDQSFTPKIKWWVIECDEADDTWQKVWGGGFLPPAYFAMETKAGLPSANCMGSSNGNRDSCLVGSCYHPVILPSMLVTADPYSQKGGEADWRWLLYSLMKWFLACLVLVTPIVLFIIIACKCLSHKY